MAMIPYSNNMMMTQQDFSLARQKQIDRLLNHADRLFSLGKVRELCLKFLSLKHENLHSSPFSDWGRLHNNDNEYLFAWHLTMSYRSTMDEIVQWAKGCMAEFLLNEVREEREQKIEEFALMRITRRWYQMDDNDAAWRVFSKNIPFNEADRAGDINKFFELLDYICILTDILKGHAEEYGLEVDYSKQAQPCERKHGMTVTDAIQELTGVVKKSLEEPRTQNNFNIEMVEKKETIIDKNYGPNIENNGTLSLPKSDE